MSGTCIRKKRSRCAPTAIATLMLLLLPSLAVGQPLADEDQRLVQTWLLTDCTVGEEEGLLEEKLRQSGEGLVPAFLRAYTDGPDSSLVASLEAGLETVLGDYQEARDTGEGLGLSPEDLEILRSISREQFVEIERDVFISGYKSQALLGLGIVGGDRAESLLQEIAVDDTTSLRESALRALQILNDRK